MIKPRFLPAAESELLKEASYYSNVLDGLGIKFLQAVESAVKNAVFNPSGGAPSPKGSRSRRVKGFPLAWYFERAIQKSSPSPLCTIEERLDIGQIA